MTRAVPFDGVGTYTLNYSNEFGQNMRIPVQRADREAVRARLREMDPPEFPGGSNDIEDDEPELILDDGDPLIDPVETDLSEDEAPVDLGAIEELLQPVPPVGDVEEMVAGPKPWLTGIERATARVSELEREKADLAVQFQAATASAEMHKGHVDRLKDAHAEWKTKLASEAQMESLRRGHCGEFDNVMTKLGLENRVQVRRGRLQRQRVVTEYADVEYNVNVGTDDHTSHMYELAREFNRNPEAEVEGIEWYAPPEDDERRSETVTVEPTRHNRFLHYLLPDGRITNQHGEIVALDDPNHTAPLNRYDR